MLRLLAGPLPLSQLLTWLQGYRMMPSPTIPAERAQVTEITTPRVVAPNWLIEIAKSLTTDFLYGTSATLTGVIVDSKASKRSFT